MQVSSVTDSLNSPIPHTISKFSHLRTLIISGGLDFILLAKRTPKHSFKKDQNASKKRQRMRKYNRHAKWMNSEVALIFVDFVSSSDAFCFFDSPKAPSSCVFFAFGCNLVVLVGAGFLSHASSWTGRPSDDRKLSCVPNIMPRSASQLSQRSQPAISPAKNDHKHIRVIRGYQRPCLAMFFPNGFGSLTICKRSNSKIQKLGCRGAAGT